MRDVTKKVKALVLKHQHLEAKIQAQQAETFTSTVSHEMRTPIQNCLFFIQQLELFFTLLIRQYRQKDYVYSEKDLSSQQKYVRLVKTQLLLTQTFVNDLLDLKQIKEGAFSLTSRPFDPNEAIKLVIEMFEQ